MKRSILLLFSINFLITIVYSQQTIKTKPELSLKTAINFTEEWQFLTSDFYLFNEDKFNSLINSLGKEPKTNLWGKLKTEKVELLSLTAKIENVEYYGNNDMVYPLYNFKMDFNKKSKYNTVITEDIEVIRLIDNLPLTTSKEFIDAKIEGEAITDSEGNKILRMVSEQLNNISKISDPTSAVLTVVGELGSFLESSANKNQYKFNSTIRLYDDTKFNKKLHSLNVYLLIPSNETNEIEFNSDKITSFIEKIKLDDRIEINKDKLLDLIGYTQYPYFVVVNYKSKYTPPKITEDEIDFDFISTYEQRILEDCEEGLNSDVVCNQEKELISFFKAFAQFKQDKEAYDLNYKNGITSELNKNLFLIMQDYKNLLILKENRDTEYKKVPSYINDFEPRYKKLISISEQYLSSSPKLNEIMLLVNTSNTLRKTDLSSLKDVDLEKYLGVMYTLDLPKDKEKTDEYAEIVKFRGSLEKNLLERVYQTKIEELKVLIGTESDFDKYKIIQTQINKSNCLLCKKEVSKELIEYKSRYDKTQREITFKKTVELKEKSKDNLTNYLNKKTCVQDVIRSKKSLSSITEAQQYVIDELQTTFDLIDRFRQLLNQNISNYSKEELLNYQNNMETISDAIGSNLKSNCERLEGIICENCMSE